MAAGTLLLLPDRRIRRRASSLELDLRSNPGQPSAFSTFISARRRLHPLVPGRETASASPAPWSITTWCLLSPWSSRPCSSDERITLLQIIGGVLILAGVYLVQSTRADRKMEALNSRGLSGNDEQSYCLSDSVSPASVSFRISAFRISYVVYPLSPCWLISSPSVSSSLVTRMPIIRSMILNRTRLTTKE